MNIFYFLFLKAGRKKNRKREGEVSQVQSFRNALFLSEHDFLLCFFEVRVCDLHSPLTKCEQTSFRANSLRLSGLGIKKKRRNFNLKNVTLISAPESSSFAMTNSSRLTSSARVIFCVKISKILFFVLASGTGNSIFLSILPGRIRAGSRDSIRLVAMITCENGG